MDEPQIIRTASGEDLVVLSRSEYQSLVEALAEEEQADIAVLDQRRAELAATSVPDLPPDVSALPLKGCRHNFPQNRERRQLSNTAGVNAVSALANPV